jgi:hypothetical protein
MRQYGIFIQPRGERRWVRLFPKRAYGKQTAVRVFQGLLLGSFFRGKKVELRPLKKETA